MDISKLHKKLIKKKTSISVAESCTGGLLSGKLTKLSDSSKYFRMGLNTYSNNAKIKILKVNRKIIKIRIQIPEFREESISDHPGGQN